MSQPSPVHLEEELTREIVHVLRVGSALQAALHRLHAKLELPAVLDEQERVQLAAAYEGTAATFRARAAKQPEGSPQRAELERRAAIFEARAGIKRSGGHMPRELRTPRERLEAVAMLRDGLVQVIEFAADVDADDIDFFESSLVDEREMRAAAAGSAGEHLDFVRGILQRMMVRLGAIADPSGNVHLLRFELSASETPDGVVTSVTPGAPGPQPRVAFVADRTETDARSSTSAPDGAGQPPNSAFVGGST